MVTDTNPGAAEEANDEGRLLSRAQGGDMEAFGNICQRFEGPLLRQAIALRCHATVAEDLVQETLVEAWKSLRRYNGSCRFYTWLCAILLNRHRTLLRRKRWLWFGSERAEASDDLERMPAGEPLPDEAAQSRDQARLIRDCIAALPARQQQVIHLRFYADDSLEGIATAAGCSVGTVKSRLFHALEKLRRMKALQTPEEPSAAQQPACANSAIPLMTL